MAGQHSAISVAAEFGLTTRQLKRVIKRILDTDIGDDLSSREVRKAIQYLDKGMKSFTISDDLYNFLWQQYEEYQKLVTRKQIASQYRIADRQLQRFFKQYRTMLVNDYLTINCFQIGHVTDYVLHAKVDAVVKAYLLYATNIRSREQRMIKINHHWINFSRLEEVKVAGKDHYQRGRILGFASDAHNKVTPVVGFYSGEITFENQIEKVYALETQYHHEPVDPTKPPVVFRFSVDEVMNRKKRGYFNLLLDVLNGQHFKVNLLLGAKHRASFLITCNAFSIDVNKYLVHSGESKADGLRKQKMWGKVSKDTIRKFLTDHLIGSSKLLSTGSHTISIFSNNVSVPLWVTPEIKKSVTQLADQREISASTLINEIFSLLPFYVKGATKPSITEAINRLLPIKN